VVKKGARGSFTTHPVPTADRTAGDPEIHRVGSASVERGLIGKSFNTGVRVRHRALDRLPLIEALSAKEKDLHCYCPAMRFGLLFKLKRPIAPSLDF